MWVLESSGEILQGKRMWLKPGKQYLFGRVKKDGVQFAIDHKTVSRKHFIIDVSNPTDSEVTQLHTRTKITILDQNSKSGTKVNGEELKGTDYKARELKNVVNSVRPGSLEQELLIKWTPCVATYNLTKKDLKSGQLKTKQDRCKKLGIKAIADFVPDATTHMIAAKRNTSKGLQALINGKWLVSESFVEALEVAASPTTLSQDENPSSLELDFDTAWPREKDFLPPPGKEPTVRPIETYQPGPDRTLVFKDYVFVFGNPTQFENLLPVVTSGHGKGLLMKVNNGHTTVDEAVKYMQNAAGRKSFGDPGDSSSRGGVVMVRWNGGEEYSDWTTDLIQQVSLKLDQRAIDQSEFLDAILANDPTLLRQAVALESFTDGLRAPPPSAAQSFAPGRGNIQAQVNGSGQTRQTSNPERTSSQRGVTSQTSRSHVGQSVNQSQTPREEHVSSTAGSHRGDSPPPAKKPRYRPPTQTRKFDDDFNPDDVVPYDDDDDVDEDASEPSQVDDSEPEPSAAPVQPPTQRKRRRSLSPAQSEGDGMDDLLPAANAMKRQRRQWEEEARRAGEPLHKATTIVAPVKSPKKELNVKEALKRQRERAKQREHLDDSEEEPLPPHDPEDKEPANLAVIEYIDLPVRRRPMRNGQNPEDDPRWDERWNGLKNFKKFRPQEKGAVRKSNHSAKVIVPMVPIPKKTGGFGEQYWDKTEEERERDKRRKKKEAKRKAQESLSQSQGRQTEVVDVSDDDGDDTRFRPGNRRVVSDDEDDVDVDGARTSPAATRLQEEAAAIVDHEIDVDSPRRTRADDARQTQSTTQRSRPASSGEPSSTAARGTKRAAATITTGSKKRQKTLAITQIANSDDSDGDSDDTKFRFGKGRGRRGMAK